MSAISEIEVFRTPFVLFVFYSVLLDYDPITLLGITETAFFSKGAKDGGRHEMMDDKFLPEERSRVVEIARSNEVCFSTLLLSLGY